MYLAAFNVEGDLITINSNYITFTIESIVLQPRISKDNAFMLNGIANVLWFKKYVKTENLNLHFIKTENFIKAVQSLTDMFNSLDPSIEQDMRLKIYIKMRFWFFFNEKEQFNLENLKFKELNSCSFLNETQCAGQGKDFFNKKPDNYCDVPGVYAFMHKQSESQSVNVYIGSSINLFQRHKQHSLKSRKTLLGNKHNFYSYTNSVGWDKMSWEPLFLFTNPFKEFILKYEVNNLTDENYFILRSFLQFEIGIHEQKLLTMLKPNLNTTYLVVFSFINWKKGYSDKANRLINKKSAKINQLGENS
jgi:hypothetical protein